MEIHQINMDIDDFFYYPIESYKFGSELIDLVNLRFQISHDYVFSRDRIFYVCLNRLKPLEKHGWKIHISACYWNCREILDACLDYLFSKKLSFKFYLDKNIVFYMNAKSANRGNSGKFITIYIGNDNVLEIMMDLADLLADFKGPYILTDRRFKNIVFYRYGTYIFSETSVIRNPNDCNEFFCDNHAPFFQLPNWIEDIMDEPEEDDSLYLNAKYEVFDAIRYTNSGGTYLARDVESGNTVIIKEARPNTCEYGINQDAITLKQREVKLLKSLNDKVCFVPRYIDYFFEWEHCFIVEEYIEGENLRLFSIKNNPLINPNSSKEEYEVFFKKLYDIGVTIYNQLKTLHKYGILLGDISSENIILNDKGCWFVDFDGATTLSENEVTLESIESNKLSKGGIVKEMQMLGWMLYSVIFGHECLISGSQNGEMILEYYRVHKGLSNELFALIISLIKNGDSTEKVPSLYTRNEPIVNIYKLLVNTTKELLINNFFNIPTPLIEGNLFSFKYGVSGVIFSLLLNESLNNSEKHFCRCMLSSNLKNIADNSFLNGRSGVLMVLSYLDFVYENIEKYLADLNDYVECSLRNSNVDYSFGKELSGIGYALLKIFEQTKEYSILDICERIGISILNTYIEFDKVGFEYGASGVANFLILLYKKTYEIKYLVKAKELIRWELSFAFSNKNESYSFPLNVDDDTLGFPYFSYGTAGILYVILKLREIKDKEFEDEIPRLINGLKIDSSVHLGFIKGLTGILFVLIKCVQQDLVTKNDILTIKKFVDMNLICYSGRVYFPGYAYKRVSIDFATGSSGFIFLLKELQEVLNDREVK